MKVLWESLPEMTAKTLFELIWEVSRTVYTSPIYLISSHSKLHILWRGPAVVNLYIVLYWSIQNIWFIQDIIKRVPLSSGILKSANLNSPPTKSRLLFCSNAHIRPKSSSWGLLIVSLVSMQWRIKTASPHPLKSVFLSLDRQRERISCSLL